MSEQEMAEKLCPYITTAQIVAQALSLGGTATEQQGMSLKGLQGLGGGNARTPNQTAVGLEGAFAYKNRIPADVLEKVNSGKLNPKDIPPEFLKPVADSLSVHCRKEACENWCTKHATSACGGGGCAQCQVEIMTQAFTAALASEEGSLGLAAARKLPSKETQENPA